MANGFDFAGQVALVTGVGRVGQIGHAVAQGFGRAGAKLVISDVSAVNVAARASEFVAQGIEAKAAAGDLTEPDVAQWAVDEALQSFGRLDVVANVAGGLTGGGPTVDAETETFDGEMASNVKTGYLVSRAAARVMVKQRRGAIVNFASIAAFHGRAEMVAYSAAKAAVANFTRWLAVHMAREYSPEIRVNAIAPTFVRTELTVPVFSSPELLARVMAHTPLGVLPEPDDIAAAVLYLAGPAARCVTGVVLPVDSGYLAR